MEAVAPHAIVIIAVRHGVTVHLFRMAVMEGGVEAGDLRHIRIDRHGLADRGQVVGLVQRGEILVTRQAIEHRGIDQHRLGIVGAAMHHPVAHRTQCEAFKGEQPVPRRGNGRRQVADNAGFIAPVDEHRSVGRFRLQARSRTDAADLTLHPALGAGICDPEDLKLQT